MIVLWDFYRNVYRGSSVSEADFLLYEDRAEELISLITRGATDAISSYPEKIQTAIKKAICYQMDYFLEYGFGIGYSADENSFTVGKVSVTEGGESESTKRAKRVCPSSIMLLEPTGLLNRSVGVLC